MRLYFDNCCYNRPFDDQLMVRIRLETEALLFFQSGILNEEFELAWSYIIDYENAQNPYPEKRQVISKWKEKAVIDVIENPSILQNALELVKHNLKNKDALHIACAIFAKCDYFLTTDDKVLNKNLLIEEIEIINPIELINIIERND